MLDKLLITANAGIVIPMDHEIKYVLITGNVLGSEVPSKELK